MGGHPTSSSSSSTSSADVIILGAGLSGLQAARTLQDAGLTSIILEARSRVGGKTWTQTNGETGAVSDLGAEWLNDTTQPHVYGRARELRLEFREVVVKGDAVLQDLDGGIVRHEYGVQAPLPNHEDETVARVRDSLEEAYNGIDLAKWYKSPHDDVTLEDFVRNRGGGPATLATVAVWTRVMLGCEPAELSAAYFLVYCRSQGGLMKMRSGKVQGRYLTVVTGTQSISQGLAASLTPGSIKLGTAAESIVQTSEGVEVRSSAGHVFRARKAIVAFSTPLYEKIRFEPPLPAEHALLARSTRIGYYTKVMASYSRPWWRDTGLCGASQAFLGPAAATRDTSVDALNRYRLTSFIAGAPGREWSRLPPAERRRAALAQLACLFGGKDEEVQEPTEYVEQQWSEEEWSLGCPCPYTLPGVLSKVGEHLTASHGHVHFAGAETAEKWKGYMEGALTAGIRGAEEVVKALRG